MIEQDNSLFAIEVDADDYAEAAADDAPSVSRTYQSEADFQAMKATYTAKIDGGNTYRDLLAAVPILHDNGDVFANGRSSSNGHGKVKLGKKDIQLLGYAVGEMYYDKQYSRIAALCGRVRECCEVDKKAVESLERWERRSSKRSSGT